MNRWQCGEPGCRRTAVGSGGAVGLRAIGWFFEPGRDIAGPTLRCPMHRPDPIPRRESTCETDLCPLCQGNRVAELLQVLLRLPGQPWPGETREVSTAKTLGAATALMSTCLQVLDVSPKIQALDARLQAAIRKELDGWRSVA